MKLTFAISLLTVLSSAFASPTCPIRPRTLSSTSAPSTTSTSSTTSLSSTTPSPTTSISSTTPPPVTSTSSTTPPPVTSTTPLTGISMAWFADWHLNFFVSNISWSYYTHMALFTAQPSSAGTIEVILCDPTMPDQFTAAAKANNVKPILTVGGWNGSVYWSSSVATAQSRSTFANSLAQYAFAHGFTGLDFDWEYPGMQGIGWNTISPQDSANFLLFLQTMRQVASNLTLSAATPMLPWVDASGSPMTDVSSYAQYLDWIEIMNYDVYGDFSSVTGPNAPLDDSCAPVGDQQGSAISAVAAWTQAGFPATKIVLGVPGYGHGYTAPQSTALSGNQLNIYTAFDNTNTPTGDWWGSVPIGMCTNATVTINTGVYNFWALIQQGFLNPDATPASGMVGMIDTCSQTPFVYDPNQQILVSYDDPQSLTAKGQYIKQAGLAGFALYELGSDYNNMLVSALNLAVS